MECDSLLGAASIQPGTQTGCYCKPPTQHSLPITLIYRLGCCFSTHVSTRASAWNQMHPRAWTSTKKYANTETHMQPVCVQFVHKCVHADTHCRCKQRKYTSARALAHTHAHTLHSSSACWRSSEPSKKCRLTKNGSHCDQSTDIYSLVAQSGHDAYSCVCVCVLQWEVKEW